MECCGKQIWTNLTKETLGRLMIGRPDEVIRGAVKAGIEMAKIGERIAELDVAKSRQEVRFMLAGYYLDLVKLQNQRQVIVRHIEQTNKVLEQMRARESAGVVLRNDITRYELQRVL